MSSRTKAILIGSGVFVAGVVLVFVVKINQMRSEIARAVEAPLAEHDLSGVADGVYLGETEFLGAAFEVEVTVAAGRMTSIKVLKDDGREYAKKAAVILDDVVEEQSLEVDAVTGATIASKVLLNTVNDALLRATASRPVESPASGAPGNADQE